MPKSTNTFKLLTILYQPTDTKTSQTTRGNHDQTFYIIYHRSLISGWHSFVTETFLRRRLFNINMEYNYMSGRVKGLGLTFPGRPYKNLQQLMLLYQRWFSQYVVNGFASIRFFNIQTLPTKSCHVMLLPWNT